MPFSINKNSSMKNNIALIENSKTIFEKNNLMDTFNNYFVNIAKKSCKIKIQSFASLTSKCY